MDIQYIVQYSKHFTHYVLSFCSKELSDALGIVANTLPPFIYRMRELGYPPGWLKEAEMENSGLMLYDGKGKGPTPPLQKKRLFCFSFFFFPPLGNLCVRLMKQKLFLFIN